MGQFSMGLHVVCNLEEFKFITRINILPWCTWHLSKGPYNGVAHAHPSCFHYKVDARSLTPTTMAYLSLACNNKISPCFCSRSRSCKWPFSVTGESFADKRQREVLVSRILQNWHLGPWGITSPSPRRLGEIFCMWDVLNVSQSRQGGRYW
jgi:hypothetical protein